MIVKLVLSEREWARCWQHFAFYQEEARQTPLAAHSGST